MDVTKQMQDIINATIKYVRETKDEASLQSILYITNNMLFILDENKSIDYRIAIISEYLEGVAGLVQQAAVQELLQYITNAKDKKAQQHICKDVLTAIQQYVSPQQINPQLVIFWLQKPCTMQTLKTMYTLMLFLSKEQQAKIFKLDKGFLSDPELMKLKSGLPAV